MKKILDLPELRQTFEYDCGAKALQSVLVYYGIERSEELLMNDAHTNSKTGTSSYGICKTLKKFALQHDARSMTADELRKFIVRNIPVIVLLQAWSNGAVNYATDFRDGHWVVVIGYDDDKLIFEDPYSFERTFLTTAELEERRHAKENGEKLVHYGIAVFGKEPLYDSTELVHMD